MEISKKNLKNDNTNQQNKQVNVQIQESNYHFTEKSVQIGNKTSTGANAFALQITAPLTGANVIHINDGYHRGHGS